MSGLAPAVGLQSWLTSQAPGLAGAAIAAITRDGQVEIATVGKPDIDGDKEVDESTPFMLGSTTKILTATLVLQQVEAGSMSLDDPVTQYVPELAGSWMIDDQAPTIRHLLSHAGGLHDIFQPFDDASHLSEILSVFSPLAAPGEILSYSNTAYVMLGLALEKVTGTSWNDLGQEKVLDVLGLKNIRLGDGQPTEEWPISPDHVFQPNGTLAKGEFWLRIPSLAAAGTTTSASIEDAASYLGSLLWGENLVCEDSLKRMQSHQMHMPGPSLACESWGLGWSIVNETQEIVAHMGGTTAFMAGSRKLGKGFVFLSNTQNAAASIGRPYILSELGLDGQATLPTHPGEQPDLPLASLVGDYYSPMFSGQVASKSENESLVCTLSSFGNVMGAVDLEFSSGSTYLGQFAGLDTEFTFVPEASSATTGDEGDKKAKFLHMTLRALRRQE